MVDKNREFSAQEIADILQANDVTLAKLSPEKRRAIERVDSIKDEQEKFLGRPLTDEEAEAIEKSDPLAWSAIMEHGDLMAGSVFEVKGKKNRNIQ